MNISFAKTKRISLILKKILKHTHSLTYQKILSLCTEKDPPNFPIAVRTLLEELGPHFIKLGQMLSLRPDLIPVEYCQAFRSLLDHTCPLEFNQIKTAIEQELEAPLSSAFKHFQQVPLASASLAQVHVAYLKKTGEKVAIKVQRPQTLHIIQQDLEIISDIATLMSLSSYVREEINPKKIAQEFIEWTTRELDFLQEGHNLEQFKQNFASNTMVHFPGVFWNYSTTRLLTMEFLEGTTLQTLLKNDQKTISLWQEYGLHKKKLIENLSEIVFTATLEHGFFHGDPHPANIIVQPHNRIGLVDVGITGTLSKEYRSKLFLLLWAINTKNDAQIMDLLQEFQNPHRTYNQDLLRQEIKNIIEEIHEVNIKEKSTAQIFYTMIITGLKHHIDWPREILLFGKELITLDGIALELVPDLNVLKHFQPYLYKLALKEFATHFDQEHLISFLLQLEKTFHTLPAELADIKQQLAHPRIEVIEKEAAITQRSKDRRARMWILSLLTSLTFLLSTLVFWSGKEILFLGFPFATMLAIIGLIALIALFIHFFL